MGRSNPHAALTEEVARFQAEVTRLAFGAALEILGGALAAQQAAQTAHQAARQTARQAARQTARPAARAAQPRERVSRRDAAAATPIAAPSPRAARVPDPPDDAVTSAPDEPTTAVAASVPPDEHDAAAAAAAAPGKRTKWTRETIIDELATWLLSGNPVDASFMTRHGPRGLVAAIRRIFGRFDAALNVASLHLTKLYPDGLPEDRRKQGRSRGGAA